mmetsp:Transcript_19046/g.44457  ORF Transcript_19046/g.44457 Transcript_19046/m.44457 type:complete len:379 (-) Transcript_19046:70-1206(-)
MVLTAELQGYAENIWKRFPEEFIALGAPSLEDHFVLRNGHSHRITDTNAQKVIEIVLRRRQGRSQACSPDGEEAEDLSDFDGNANNVSWPCSRSKERVQNGLDHLYQAVQGLASILVECLPEDLPNHARSGASSPTGRENSPRDSLAQRRGMRPLAVNADVKTEAARLGPVVKIPSDDEAPAMQLKGAPIAAPLDGRMHCKGGMHPGAMPRAAGCPKGGHGVPAEEESPGTRIQRWAENKKRNAGKGSSAPVDHVLHTGHPCGAGHPHPHSHALPPPASNFQHDQAMALAMAPARDIVARNLRLGPGYAGSACGLELPVPGPGRGGHSMISNSLNSSYASHSEMDVYGSEMRYDTPAGANAKMAMGEPGSPQRSRFRK